MAGPKTSAEKSREDEKNAAADDMFGGAFGGLEEMEVSETAPVEEPESHSEETEETDTQTEDTDNLAEDISIDIPTDKTDEETS